VDPLHRYGHCTRRAFIRRVGVRQPHHDRHLRITYPMAIVTGEFYFSFGPMDRLLGRLRRLEARLPGYQVVPRAAAAALGCEGR
jgi:hypothetical protein